ncbi:manganese efflux pump MntP [Lutispora saccharofermentans]|uniref:Putative manganese efflux pump MntP n=1 Tax=Lutispora saccharofermentans TaxID=3024236 RepID=A0ABT1NG96_9FIRM|nr:manganese efflux pump MntP family protein [Lutispora saccharofermentans]MCQ1528871.1 manganese efflux pump MntP family protein [Lutispora saccharofermentans]
MDILTIVLIALGLAMDAFAVSVSSGITIKDLKPRHGVKIALFFGGFQALMPILGWLLGIGFKDYIEKYDHWIAFVLLGFIGAKMLKEAMDDDCEYISDPLQNKVLFMLAIATSIDAMAVGVSFAFLKASILSSSLIIGAITCVICFGGVYLGNKCGCVFKKKAEIAGGVVLILIGFKILAEHSGFTTVVLNMFK